MLINCEGQNHSLVVDYPSDGQIFINDLPLERWLTGEPKIMEENTNLYFLNLSMQKYDLRIILSDDSIIDTFFVVKSGESYFAIDLKTGELAGFEY
jgi:hypothetical protein